MDTSEASYCTALVMREDRDRFLSALFVSEQIRVQLLALCAFNVELSHIHQLVSEEMIGHIRYAWWQEAIEKLYQGIAPKGHPVLEALLPVAQGGHLHQEAVMPLLESHRAHFPDPPADSNAIMDNLSVSLLQSIAPGEEKGWQKAHEIIARHRKRYGKGWNIWLEIKLLLAGFL